MHAATAGAQHPGIEKGVTHLGRVSRAPRGLDEVDVALHCHKVADAAHRVPAVLRAVRVDVVHLRARMLRLWTGREVGQGL